MGGARAGRAPPRSANATQNNFKPSSQKLGRLYGKPRNMKSMMFEFVRKVHVLQ